MRKTLAATVATLALIFGLAPAASAALPPCPERATLASVTDGCELPAYPAAARPAIFYAFSAFDLLRDYLMQAHETIEAQAATIERKQARIERLRARLARAR